MTKTKMAERLGALFSILILGYFAQKLYEVVRANDWITSHPTTTILLALSVSIVFSLLFAQFLFGARKLGSDREEELEPALIPDHPIRSEYSRPSQL